MSSGTYMSHLVTTLTHKGIKGKSSEKISKFMSDFLGELDAMSNDDDPFKPEETQSQELQRLTITKQREKILGMKERASRQPDYKHAQDVRIAAMYKLVEQIDPDFKSGTTTTDPINIKDKKHYGQTLLHKAAEIGDLEEVKRLTKAGADTTIKDNSGSTAKMLATQEGFDDITDWLDN